MIEANIDEKLTETEDEVFFNNDTDGARFIWCNSKDVEKYSTKTFFN